MARSLTASQRTLEQALPVVVPATNRPSRIGAIALGFVDIEGPLDESIQARFLAQEKVQELE
ncbi:MAG: hypothetical protein P8L46_14700 [Acidimicrobiales bacterium]|nr:hypothetical protein [Acidimicrobiales bacterium]